MQIKIIETKENPVLDRKELKIDIDHVSEPTPSVDEVKAKLAAEESLDKELIIVDEINTEFGSNRSNGYIKVYEDTDSLKKVENQYMLERNLEVEE
ncbi:MAG: Ribosomal protein S24E [Candidatus Methanohalarchaeum thermophilum]|uniref:Small ribosomal subunit protein eS24 n=1 Tax=Methanohalarchaeum thermophilum TaxID=1903181 RepID=A0A1Q6DV46_METT1|nr:MAG: Ribosomal protein S24E [Candidatus Methanohalarchaeum thermophilum]